MGENKMETLGKDTTQVECEQPDDNEGGILRRLRNRDLLRKRRAEAEEKAIYQWVYGVQSKRKKEWPEGRSRPSRKGRPKKNEAVVLLQPPQEGALEDGRAEQELSQEAAPPLAEKEQLTLDPAKEEEPVTCDADKSEEPLAANTADVAVEPPAAAVEGEGAAVLLPTLSPPLSQPPVSLLPAPAPPTPPAPETHPEVVPDPAPERAPQPEIRSDAPKEEVTIEDLGPEDEEEKEPPPPRDLVPEPGTSEAPGDNAMDSRPTQTFSISSIVSPPQPSYLPGP